MFVSDILSSPNAQPIQSNPIAAWTWANWVIVVGTYAVCFTMLLAEFWSAHYTFNMSHALIVLLISVLFWFACLLSLLCFSLSLVSCQFLYVFSVQSNAICNRFVNGLVVSLTDHRQVLATKVHLVLILFACLFVCVCSLFILRCCSFSLHGIREHPNWCWLHKHCARCLHSPLDSA